AGAEAEQHHPARCPGVDGAVTGVPEARCRGGLVEPREADEHQDEQGPGDESLPEHRSMLVGGGWTMRLRRAGVILPPSTAHPHADRITASVFSKPVRATVIGSCFQYSSL
ncbi:MAG: hypothetical protein ACK56I_12195, partial [bacterium]